MTGMSRIGTEASMLTREFLRRRAAPILLLVLPLAFYLVQLSDEIDALVAGSIGVAWAVAATALFSSLAARPVDPRLVLAGYSPRELFLGRLLFLETLSLSLVAFFSIVILTLSRPADPAAVVLAIALTSVIAVPLGLLTAVVLPRELEGTLLLIGVVGVQMAIQPPTPILPLFGPLRLLEIAAGSPASPLPAVGHGIGISVLVFGAAALRWNGRLARP